MVGLLAAGAGAVLVVALFVFQRGGGDAAAPAQAAEHVAGIDLAALPDPPRLEGTTDDEWKVINDLVARYVTPPFSDESQKAGDHLMVRGKRSVPAMLAGFKRLDLGTRDGMTIGVKMQMLLQGLCGDVNFGWHRDTRPEDVAFNQRVIQRWLEAWAQAGEDDAKWAEIRATASATPAAK